MVGLCGRAPNVYASLVFRRRSSDQAVAGATAADAAPGKARNGVQTAEPSGKGRATPTRRQAEIARKAKLGVLPSDPKERRRAERAARSDSYSRERLAVKSGDTRNYPLRDRGPARAFVRDYVDRRLRLLEFLMPAAVLSLFAPVLVRNNTLAVDVTFGMELIVFVGILLGALLNFRVKRAVRAQFGDSEVRGTGFYAFSRAAMPRVLRQPKAVVTFTGKPK